METNIAKFLETTQVFFADETEIELDKNNKRILHVLLIEDDEFILDVVKEEIIDNELLNWRVNLEIAKTLDELNGILIGIITTWRHFDYVFLDGKLGKETTMGITSDIANKFDTHSISASTEIAEYHLENWAISVMQKLDLLWFLEDKIKEIDNWDQK